MASVADDPGPGRPPPVMLLGPTASGKSAVAMALAGRLPVDIEIVSVDSAQVYRGMDIGTAKPDAAERARVPHHLIDIVDPQDSYSAARFADDARATVRAVQARGRLPLLVGGTMLYARAFTHGLHALPPADARLRASLLEEAGRLGWPAMHARLATLDPATAARLAPHDAQRIERALEICVLTGEPMSALLRRPAAGGWPGPLLTLVLEPADRAALHARIGARFEAMIAAGLVGEVEALRARPGMHAGLPSMRSVGYRQVWEWLDAGAREPVSALVAAGATATRRLAKRQLTWLRSMSGVVRVDSESTDRTDRIADAILAALGR